MGVLIILLGIIDVLICIALVVLVVFQEGNSKGLGPISGGAETFFGKSKSQSKEALMKRLTSVLAITFAIVSIVLYLLTGRGG